MLLFVMNPESDPICSTSPPSEVHLHDAVQMYCGTLVRGNLPLVTNWTMENEVVDNPTYRPINNVTFNGSTISMQAVHIPVVPQYTCTMSFGAPPSSAGMANNTPTYNGSCSTDELQVHCEFVNSLYQLLCLLQAAALSIAHSSV